ncbi:MAG: hypothetical protein ACJ8LG_22195 [Massilia sp.]
MTMFGRALFAAPLVGALVLAGCGGDASAPQMQDKQAGQGIAVGEPNGGQPVVASFIKLAQEEACTDIRNRLFVIDGKQVFWDRAGKCGDMSYAQTLFGATPEQVLCSVSDSIAGPRTFCADDKSRALFDTIQKNLDKADLGLAGHKVEPLPFLPKSGSAIPFQSLERDSSSGIKVAKNVVVKDAAALEQLWAEHTGNRGTPRSAPKVDFDHQMVLAVFSGQQASGCHTIAIVRVGADNGKIVVEYDDRDAATEACPAVLPAPMQMVVVERSDAPVEFVAATAAQLRFRTIDQTTRSDISIARNVVIKDPGSWSALWVQHAGAGAALPVIDFSKQMVIAVFLGNQSGGCYSTNIKQVSQFANKLTVLHADTVPGPTVLCTMQVTRPAHLVAVDRSDQTVEFATEVDPIK